MFSFLLFPSLFPSTSSKPFSSLNPKTNLMKKKMFPTKFLLVVALWLSLSNFAFEAYGDTSGDVITSPIACLNCSKCEYPCQQPSPPLPGYTPYAAPPPPSPPPSGYSIYGAPPPPYEKDHTKCPPAEGVQCCTPPATYTFHPPNPYTPVPYGEGQGSASTLLSVLVPLMMLLSSFVFLF